MLPQDSFENYTQTAHWGTDQSFQFFSGNSEPQGQQPQPSGSGSVDNSPYSFGSTNMSGQS